MKFKVNDSCIGCGLCAGTCPEVFTLDDAPAKAIETDIPADVLASATEAKDNCPVGAIEEA